MPPPSVLRSVLRATLEYDGGHYRGWQAQVNARTVQGELMRACREVLGKDVKINGAGRTDAGVHAFAQVASLHGASVRAAELGKVRQDLNDLLPPDINLLRLAAAPPSFHARHSAKERIYRYRISRRRTAFGKRFVYWVKDRLDASAMQAAADLFVGRHDFASFAENAEGHDSTLVEVAFARVETPPDAPDLIFFRIGASHFLWKMVRRLTGTLLEVGRGRLDAAGVRALLESRSGKPAEWTAPPSGLFLESVAYPGDPPPPAIDPYRPGF
jgi:tRNA pseudouridine38-40 synthase